jgi:putative transposase
VTFSTYKRRRFLDSEQTRDIVIEVLQKCLVTHKAVCGGFVVMPNHVHALLLGEENFKISPFMQVWKKTSSYRIREYFQRELPTFLNALPDDGPIWQASFYDSTIDTDKLHNEKLRYMHNNPVTAKLAETHIDWRWSSARFYKLDEPVGVTITP